MSEARSEMSTAFGERLAQYCDEWLRAALASTDHALRGWPGNVLFFEGGPVEVAAENAERLTAQWMSNADECDLEALVASLSTLGHALLDARVSGEAVISDWIAMARQARYDAEQLPENQRAAVGTFMILNQAQFVFEKLKALLDLAECHTVPLGTWPDDTSLNRELVALQDVLGFDLAWVQRSMSAGNGEPSMTV